MKRLVIVDGAVAVTGGFVAALNIAEAVRSHAKTFIVLPSDSSIKAQDFADICEIIYMPLPKLRRRFKSVLTFIPLALYSGMLLKRHLNQLECHALVINDFYLTTGSIMRLLGFKRKIVTWVRIDPAVYGRTISRILLAAALISSDNIVAVSDFIRAKLPTSRRIVRLYDALRPSWSKFDHVSRVQLGEGRRRIVYIGNYIQGKGQDRAIAAFAGLASRYPDVELAFFGGDMGLEKNKEYRLRLEADVRSRHLEEQIRFHDFTKEVTPVLATATIALNFSESESFSLTCLEAGGIGLPMVVTRSGGPEEIIADGETGILVRQGDVPAMRDAIDRLLADREFAERMGSNAARRIREKFSFERFARDVTFILGLSSGSTTSS